MKLLKFTNTSNKTNKTELLQVEGLTLRVRRQAFRRSISLAVRSNGNLDITAPKGAGKRALIQFTLKHKAWLEGQKIKVQQRFSGVPQKFGFAQEKYMFLGERRKLILKPASHKKLKVQVQGLHMIVSGHELSSRKVLKYIRRYYKIEGERILRRCVELRSREMKLFPKKLIFRAQSTCWGSCSSNGTLSLNWKLALAPVEVLDYVVVHELAHLKYQDHSHKFWKLVSEYSANYKKQKTWLEQHSHEFDFLVPISEYHASFWK